MAYRAAARSPPATVCTFSCSTRSRTFVRAPVGSGSESATITRTSRPATLWPTSSQNRLKPSVMSLPVWEKLPVSGPKYPIRMGPRSAARGSRGRPARPSAAAPIATRNARLRMSPSFSGSLAPMLVATRDKILPTTMTGSYPRPQWFTEGLRGRAFKDALGDSVFREQYRSEEHTSELQSLAYLVCRLLLEKKKKMDSINDT